MKKELYGFVWLVLFLFLAIAMSANQGWAAEKYPSKPITLIVGYGAGGSTDVVARTLSEAAKTYLDVPIAIVNKPGASTAIAMEAVRTAKPDGYTLGVSTTSSMAMVRLGNAKYDFFNDFTHICNLTKWVVGFSVSSTSPWKTLKELLDYARENPGKLKFSIAGMGSTAHLVIEDVFYQAGVKLVYLPIESDAQAAASLIGGHIQAASTTWMGFGEFAKSGKTRLLVVFTDKRIPEFPDVPTAKELGFKIGSKGPVGVVGPKGLPDDVVKTVSEAYRKASEEPKIAKQLESIHYPPLYMSTEEFKQDCREYDEWSTEIMKRIGMIK